MRLMLTVSTAALLAASAAVAQYSNAPPAANAPAPSATQSAPANADAPATTNNAPANPAVKTTEGNNPGAPAPGANSFTEGQAKARIEARGYANVSDLAKDTNGFWRGKAMKDGKPVNVTLDYQGNVTVN
jgi:hypothetical protein